MGAQTAQLQAYDVALPEQDQIRAVPIDTGGITEDIDAIITSVATATALQTLTGTGGDFDGALAGQSPDLDAVISPACNLVLTLNSHADWDASTITVTGTDYAGASLSEDFTVPNGGNTTLVGSSLFATVTTVAIPAQSGTNGTLGVGIGALASLEEYAHDQDDRSRPGRYITMVGTVDWYLTAGAAGAAISTPSLTVVVPALAADSSARTAGPFLAGVHYSMRAKAGATDAITPRGASASGIVRWWRSS